MSSRRRTTIAWTTAAVLVTAGVVTTGIGLMTPAAFGWFAYQPLSSAWFSGGGGGIFVSRVTMVGSFVLALGLVAAAFLLGIRVGARRRPDDTSSPS